MAHELLIERARHDRELLRAIAPAVNRLEQAAADARAASDALKRRRGVELSAWQQFLALLVTLAAVLELLRSFGVLH